MDLLGYPRMVLTQVSYFGDFDFQTYTSNKGTFYINNILLG